MSVLLECRCIRKHAGSFILSDIQFDLEPGYILGVVGKNGAGKSTLMRILRGSYLLTGSYADHYDDVAERTQGSGDCGNVKLQGISINTDPKAYKEKIACVLQDSPFDLRLSAVDNGKLYGSYYAAFRQDKYVNWLSKLDVPAKVPLCRLSKGEQIKQQLAFALSYDAKLYLFDEPAGNLDVAFRKEFYEQIRKLVEDDSKGVIYVSHLVDEMEQFADYLLWIEEGKQKYFGSVEEFREQFQLVEGTIPEYQKQLQDTLVGSRIRENHQEILVRKKREELPPALQSISRYASLREILYYMSR